MLTLFALNILRRFAEWRRRDRNDHMDGAWIAARRLKE